MPLAATQPNVQPASSTPSLVARPLSKEVNLSAANQQQRQPPASLSTIKILTIETFPKLGSNYRSIYKPTPQSIPKDMILLHSGGVL